MFTVRNGCILFLFLFFNKRKWEFLIDEDNLERLIQQRWRQEYHQGSKEGTKIQLSTGKAVAPERTESGEEGKHIPNDHSQSGTKRQRAETCRRRMRTCGDDKMLSCPRSELYHWQFYPKLRWKSQQKLLSLWLGRNRIWKKM